MRVWALLYAQLHKNYLNAVSFQLGTLIRFDSHLLVSSFSHSYTRTLVLVTIQRKHWKTLFRSESVNYVNVLICNYVYVSNVYYIIILLCQPDDMFIYIFFFLFLFTLSPLHTVACATLLMISWIGATFSPRKVFFLTFESSI